MRAMVGDTGYGGHGHRVCSSQAVRAKTTLDGVNWMDSSKTGHSRDRGLIANPGLIIAPSSVPRNSGHRIT